MTERNGERFHTDYEPNQFDIAWMKNMIAMICDGGTLAYPDAALVFAVNKKTKSLVLLNPEVLIFDDSLETYKRTKKVCATFHWNVNTSE